MNQQLLRTFLIGMSSSIFILILLGNQYRKLSCDELKELKIRYNTLVIILPFLTGLIYIIFNYIFTIIMDDRYLRYLVAGAVSGLFYSLLARYLTYIPDKVFKLKNPDYFFLINTITSTFIYGTWIYFLEIYLPI